MNTPYRFVPILSPLYWAVRRFVFQFFYAGNQVECPLCQRRFKRWLHHSELGACPYCRSAPRHRLMWLWLLSEWKGDWQPGKLLHFAPEWCLRRRLRHEHRLAHYVTCDLSAPDVDFHVDITSIIFEDRAYDTIICSHVLEHVPDDARAISELFRVLRPGGVAIIQVPYAADRAETDEDLSVTDPQERERRFGQFDHVRLYGRDFGDRLRRGGFIVEEVRPFRQLKEEERRRFGVWDDTLFRCKRL